MPVRGPTQEGPTPLDYVDESQVCRLVNFTYSFSPFPTEQEAPPGAVLGSPPGTQTVQRLGGGGTGQITGKGTGKAGHRAVTGRGACPGGSAHSAGSQRASGASSPLPVPYTKVCPFLNEDLSTPPNTVQIQSNPVWTEQTAHANDRHTENINYRSRVFPFWLNLIFFFCLTVLTNYSTMNPSSL